MPSLEFMLESNSGEPSAKGSGITVMTEDSRVQNSNNNAKSRRGGRRPSALGSALGSLQGPAVPSTDQDTCVGTVDSRTLKDSTTRKAKRPGGRRPSRLDCLDKEKLRSCFA